MHNNPTEIAMKIGFKNFNDSIDTVCFNDKIASIKFVNDYLLQITVKNNKLYYEFATVYEDD